ncbi:hypothetical protein P170DRAFT_503159 [Aspergillus steynii IBT 23096]|uniref:Uncharacterized protein n=1 Tax=Aspergillus steynii IBT 23096 TaxID=1392250 RepID=A0A2I2FUU9_9EURO|nr:uncharacterized protein P170DRAFT_503159 [Aspergillus steynii IBT 23096]PLB44425.1 hypothetical protein P170DRAFT_503159 [Aspergillus steynii IBT 23096]
MELRYLLVGGEDADAGQYEKDLMTVLIELDAVPTLRGARRQQPYLTEFFGNVIPREENDEDLRKERCREKYDALFFYLSKVRAFKAWDQSAKSRITEEPLIEELREAQIDALRADLGRIHAECEVVFASQSLLNTDQQGVDSGSATFAIMTVKSLCLCATIMLHQAVHHTAKTDQQAQSAAQELIRLARLMRKFKCLASPCSIIWPLPVYFAGIAVTDEIY